MLFAKNPLLIGFQSSNIKSMKTLYQGQIIAVPKLTKLVHHINLLRCSGQSTDFTVVQRIRCSTFRPYLASSLSAGLVQAIIIINC